MTHTQLVEQLHRSEAELAGLSKFVSDMTSAVDKQIKTLQAHADAAVLVAHLVQSFAFNCVTTEDDGDMVELSKSATSVGGFVKAQHGVFDNKLRADLAEMLNKYAAVERRLAMHGEHRRAVRDLAKRADDAQERLAGMQRRSKVDLVKMAEQQQERDACNERCRRAAADALAEYARLRLDFFACAMEEFNHYVRSHERYLHDTADALRPLTDKASAWHQAAIDLKARSTSGGDAAGSLTGSTTSGIAQQQSQGQQHQQQGPGQKQANQQQQTKQQQHEIVTKIPALQRFVADEKGLVKTLEMLLDEFLDSVMKDGSLFAEMGRDDVSLIFSGVRALYHLHREVLERFAATQSLAATFNEAFVVRLVHTYERYCKTFLVSQEALYQCRKKSRAFAHLVQDVEARTGCSSQGQGNSSSSSGSNNSTGGVDELFAAPLKRIAGYVGLFHDADQLHLTAAEYEYCTRVGETLRELDAEAQRALGASTVRQVLRAVQGWPEGGGCGSALAPERRFVARFAAAAPAGQGELLVFSDCAVFARRPALAGLAGLAGRRHLQSVHAFPAAALAVRDVPDDAARRVAATVELADTADGTTLALALEGEHGAKAAALAALRNVQAPEGSSTRLFGVRLDVLMQGRAQQGRDVPTIVADTAAVLEARWLGLEGLFRISASKAELDDLRQRLDSGAAVDYARVSGHSVAGILKLWLRSLPEPLVPFALYGDFAGALAGRSADDGVRTLAALVRRLPPLNRQCLHRLALLLHRVVDHAAENMMHASNISIVFTPLLLRDRDHELLLGDLAGSTFDCVAALVTHCDAIFGPYTPLPPSQRGGGNGTNGSGNGSGSGTRRKKIVVPPVTREESAELDASFTVFDENGASASVGPAAAEAALSLRDIVRQGLLLKNRERKQAVWDQRWVVVKKGWLYDFRNQRDTNCAIVPLQSAIVCEHTDPLGKQRFAFVVRPAHTSAPGSSSDAQSDIVFAAKSADEMTQWIRAISSCII